MATATLVKITAATAAEICARFRLPDGARALLRPEMPPGEFVTALLAHKHYVAGIDFMAHTLPAREGIWWGCLCLQHACADSLTPEEKAALAPAVQWVLQPSDGARAAAKAQGEALGPASAAGAVAMAAYQTGQPFCRAGGPSLPAQPFASANSLANAVKLACTRSAPARIVETQRLFVELAIGVAGGRDAQTEVPQAGN